VILQDAGAEWLVTYPRIKEAVRVTTRCAHC